MVHFSLTPRIRSGLEALLSAQAIKLPERERTEYESVRADVSEHASISFSCATRLASRLRELAQNDSSVSTIWAHDLLDGSKEVLPPEMRVEPGSAAARSLALRIGYEQQQYDRMVGSVGRNKDTASKEKSGLSAYMNDIGTGVYIIVTMVGVFTAGYWVVSHTYGNQVWAVITGVFAAIIALMAEVWMIIIRGERENQLEGKKKKRQQVSTPRTQSHTAVVVLEQYSAGGTTLTSLSPSNSLSLSPSPTPSSPSPLASSSPRRRGKQKSS